MKNNARNIGTVVASMTLAMGIMAAKPAFASHQTCEQIGQDLAAYVNSLPAEEKDILLGKGTTYGNPGEVSPADGKYDACIVEEFNKTIQGQYTLETIKNHPSWDNGTVYMLQPKQAEPAQ